MFDRKPFLKLSVASVSLFLAGGIAAAPVYPTLSETARCRVTLAEASYDDPDADDAEFLELRVEQNTAAPSDLTDAQPSGGKDLACSLSLPEGGAGLDAGFGNAPDGSSRRDAAAAPLTLGDCGLALIELVNGGNGACEKYRTLAVGSLQVPADGYLVLCAVDSSLAVSGACDVSAVGSSTLKNGWLQNGPNDGLRFLGPGGEDLAELAYEGGPACFVSPGWLRDETGKIPSPSGTPEDDVSVLCGTEYRLVPQSAAPFHAPVNCETKNLDAGIFDGSGAPDGSSWVPEYAPPSAGGNPGWSGVGGSANVAAPSSPVHGRVPSSPSCSVDRASADKRSGFGYLAPVLVALRRRKRRRPAESLPPARSSARFGSSRPR